MVCTKCGKEKTPEETKPHFLWCRSCYNEYYRAWKKTPSGKAAEKRYKKYPRVIAYNRKYYREWYAKNGRNRAIDYVEAIIDWQKKHPEAVKAQRLLRYAVKIGKTIKPKSCHNCKQEKRLSAHHNNYSKPLEVLWLCSSCHKLIHKDIVDKVVLPMI